MTQGREIFPYIPSAIRLRAIDLDLLANISNTKVLANALGIKDFVFNAWRLDPIRGPAFRDCIIDCAEKIGRAEFNSIPELMQWLSIQIERRVRFKGTKLLQNFYVLALHSKYMQIKRQAVEAQKEMLNTGAFQLSFDFVEYAEDDKPLHLIPSEILDEYLHCPGGIGGDYFDMPDANTIKHPVMPKIDGRKLMQFHLLDIWV